MYDQAVEDRPLEDTQLVERARDGDIAAYEELVVKYERIAYTVARMTIGDTEGAADAVQNAFIKAYYALNRFRPGTSFRPWLVKIVVNEAHNAQRSARRRSDRERRLAEGRPRDDAVPSPDAAAFAAERRETLLRAVNALDEEDRLVISYRYFLELSETEMAEALGCPRGTVKSRLSRALKRLKETLGPTDLELLNMGSADD